MLKLINNTLCQVLSCKALSYKVLSCIQSLLALCVVLTFMSNNANAHQLSTAYLTMEKTSETTITGQWQLRGFDLQLALGLDRDKNGQLTWRELNSQKTALFSYLSQHLLLKQGDSQCAVEYHPQLQTDRHFDQGFIVASFEANCTSSGSLNIEYQAIFAQDSDHKVIVNMAGQVTNESRVLSADNRSIELSGSQNALMDTMLDYIEQGIIHIFIGIDHILFLVVLLLTCVLHRQQGQWQVRQSVRVIVVNTAYIVTAFTLAHSVTLTATAMNWITPDSRWVEVGIALSVLFAAINNIVPMVVRLGWLTFAFGLLHGMGFAGVLGELGLPSEQKFWSILAFNLGVEFGQLAILAVLLPVLVFVRQVNWYRRYGVNIGSAMIALVSLNWAIERLSFA